MLSHGWNSGGRSVPWRGLTPCPPLLASFAPSPDFDGGVTPSRKLAGEGVTLALNLAQLFSAILGWASGDGSALALRRKTLNHTLAA
jgi:hypothetical protein